MSPIGFVPFCENVLRVRFSPAQRTLWRVAFDGVQPRDLEGDDREHARALFGDVDVVPDKARHVLALLKGARVGGTWGCSLYLLYRALTADLSMLAAGEIAYAPIVAPDLKTARVALAYALGAARGTPSIARLIVSETADNFTLRRPDGCSVSVECLAASRGGRATRGRTMVAGQLDESCFFMDPSTGVVNDAELYRAMVVRVIPGGTLCVLSTAWTEAGLLWDLVKKNHGEPKGALAAVAPTLLMRSDATITSVVEAERERDPRNAAREFDCVPFPPEGTTYFDARAIEAAVDESLELPSPFEATAVHTVGADFGFRSDSSALVVVQRDAERFRVADLLELKPGRDAPLVPSDVVRQFAARARRYRCEAVTADAHYEEAIREHLYEHGLYLTRALAGASGKSEAYAVARSVLHEGKLRLPNDPRLLRQLREVRAQPTAGGAMTIKSPRWAGGGHGDLVSALVLAVWRAFKLAPPEPVERPPEPGSIEARAEEWRAHKRSLIAKAEAEQVAEEHELLVDEWLTAEDW